MSVCSRRVVNVLVLATIAASRSAGSTWPEVAVLHADEGGKGDRSGVTVTSVAFGPPIAGPDRSLLATGTGQIGEATFYSAGTDWATVSSVATGSTAFTAPVTSVSWAPEPVDGALLAALTMRNGEIILYDSTHNTTQAVLRHRSLTSVQGRAPPGRWGPNRPGT